MCRSGKLSKRPHSVRLSVSRRPFSSLIVSQPIKCFLKNNLLIIIIHIYSTYQYVSQGDGRISRETGEELNRVSWGTSNELFYPPHQFLFSTAISFWIFFFLLLFEGCQSANVVPEGGFALGLSQHEDLLLGQSRRERRVFLSQQEVVVRSCHRWADKENKASLLSRKSFRAY